MKESFPINGLLAVFLLVIGIAGMTRLFPHTQLVSMVCLLSIAGSFLFALLGLRTRKRYDKVCAVTTLVVLVTLFLISLLVPAISR